MLGSYAFNENSQTKVKSLTRAFPSSNVKVIITLRDGSVKIFNRMNNQTYEDLYKFIEMHEKGYPYLKAFLKHNGKKICETYVNVDNLVLALHTIVSTEQQFAADNHLTLLAELLPDGDEFGHRKQVFIWHSSKLYAGKEHSDCVHDMNDCSCEDIVTGAIMENFVWVYPSRRKNNSELYKALRTAFKELPIYVEVEGEYLRRIY